MSLKYIMVKKQHRNTKKRGRNNKSRKQRGGKTPTKIGKTPPKVETPKVETSKVETSNHYDEFSRKIPNGYERSGPGTIRKEPGCTIS
jgi:hypothetical protein